jgi:hypothetical protein
MGRTTGIAGKDWTKEDRTARKGMSIASTRYSNYRNTAADSNPAENGDAPRRRRPGTRPGQKWIHAQRASVFGMITPRNIDSID